jgi:hypothetical protein
VFRNPCSACACRVARSPLQVWHYQVLRRIVTAAETGFHRELDRLAQVPMRCGQRCRSDLWQGLPAAQRNAVREAVGARYNRMRAIVEVWAQRRGVYGKTVTEPLPARADAIAECWTHQRVGLQQVVTPNGQRPARYPKLSGCDIMILVEWCLASTRNG